MALNATVEIAAGSRTFASGLLLELIDALRRTRRGDLIALSGDQAAVGADLESWSRLTGHSIVDVTRQGGFTRWIIRNGPAVPRDQQEERPLGTRIWLYTNFDCNLRCDYCCVRSSPEAPRRELGLERVRRIAREAAPIGVRDFFVTGGEPFLLPNIAEILLACAEVAPTTVLTNGMLFKGPRLDELRRLPRGRVTLQISLDSPTPDLHDLHRGRRTWARAWEGVQIARREGFRVRLAATVSTDEEEESFRAFMGRESVSAENRIIRRIALRGFAERGVALSRADLIPEVTITAEGVYWHPVGAEDADLLVTRDIFPLADAMQAVRQAAEREAEHGTRMARIFHCA